MRPFRKTKISSAFLMLLFLPIVSCTSEQDLKDNMGKFKSQEISIPSTDQLNQLYSKSNLKFDDKVKSLNLNIQTKMTTENKLNDLFVKGNGGIISVKGLVYYKKSNKIKGLGIYFYSKNKNNYFMNFYKLNQNSSFEKKASYRLNDVLMENIVYYRNKEFKNNDIVIFAVENFEKSKNNINYNDITLAKTVNDLKNIGIEAKMPEDEPDAWCGVVGNCKTGNGGACKPFLFYCDHTDPGDCPLLQVRYQVTEYGDYPIEYIASTMPYEKYFNFRDNFLAKSEKGRAYTNLYYDSSRHFYDALDFNLAVQIFEIFPEINQSIDNLMNSGYSGIIVDQTLKNNIFSITGILKNRTSSSVFIDAIETFENDLNQITDMSRNEVLNFFN